MKHAVPSFREMTAQQRADSMDNIVKQVAALTTAYKGFFARSFWQRVRWIVTGR